VELKIYLLHAPFPVYGLLNKTLPRWQPEHGSMDIKKISGQATGGTRRLFLTVAIFRSWRDSKGCAAPGLPGRLQGYPM
jgi:hypothetical protein